MPLHQNLSELTQIAGTISFENKINCVLNKYAETFRKTVGKKPAKVNLLS
jgi:hypothetical protein